MTQEEQFITVGEPNSEAPEATVEETAVEETTPAVDVEPSVSEGSTEETHTVEVKQKQSASLPRSWEDESTFFQLTTQVKNKEIVKGIIRSVRKNSEIDFADFNGTRRIQRKLKEEILVVTFENGIQAYCPTSEFYGHSFKSYAGFVGMEFNFIVIGFDMEQRVAVLSESRAAEITSKEFMNELINTPMEELAYKKFVGTVSGYNPDGDNGSTIFVRIQGKDCFMKSWDWDYNLQTKVPEYVLERGEQFEVVVKDYDVKTGLVHVSRKLAMSNPYSFLQHLQPGDFVAGRVYEKTPTAIFVEVETGVMLLGDVQKNVTEPEIGDKVQCRVIWVAADKRKGKVSIYGYPNGKRKSRAPGSFLFD